MRDSKLTEEEVQRFKDLRSQSGTRMSEDEREKFQEKCQKMVPENASQQYQHGSFSSSSSSSFFARSCSPPEKVFYGTTSIYNFYEVKGDKPYQFQKETVLSIKPS